jgi:WD40 repeat protein
MKPMLAPLAFTLALCAGNTLAQTGKSGKVDPIIIGENLSPKLGAPLSARALITSPAPVKGVLSWTIETRRIRHRFSVTALSPDGKLVATGGLDGIIRLWDVDTGTLVKALVGHDSYVYGLAFSPGGKYLASGGSFDATARIWEVATGQPLRVLKGHPSWVSQVVWSGDGRKLIGEGGPSGDISIWNVDSGQKIAKAALGQYIVSLVADPTKERFAAVTTESAVIITSSVTGKAERNIGEALDKTTRLAWSPDGKTLAAGGAKGTFLYDPDTGKSTRKVDATGHALDWSADSSRLATASGADSTIKLWNAADGALIHKVSATANTLHLLPGDRFLTGDTVGLATYSWADGKRALYLDITEYVPPYWHPGRPLVTGVQTATLSLWDPATGKRRAKLEGHTSSISAFVFSPDGKQVATASYDKTVKVFNTADGAVVHTCAKHSGPVMSIAWSPDGKEIASGAQDKQTLVWDAKTGELTHTLTEHKATVTCLAFSPSGGTLAAGGEDGKLVLYARPGWKTAKPLLNSHQVSPMSLAWSSDGKTLAVGDANGNVVMWTPGKAKIVAELPTVGSPPHVASMVFYAKGEMIATARLNHTLVLWSVGTEKAIHTLPTMAPAVHVVWSAPHLAVAAHDRTCRFFEPISGKLKGLYLAEQDQIVALSPDGHYRAEGPAADGLVVVVQTPKGQDTLTLAEFAAKYKWKNDPTQVKFAGK